MKKILLFILFTLSFNIFSENLENLKISISEDKANYFTNSKRFNVSSKS